MKDMGVVKVMSSHPQLEWFKQLNLPRQMPPQAVARIMKVEGKEDAKAMALSLQLGLRFRIRGREEELLQFSYFPAGLKEYFPFQLFMSTDIAGELPFGSAIVRFSLPPTDGLEEGEAVFQKFQNITARVCAGILEAAPFCALMGFDSEQAWRSKSAKGFTFFFSSDPDKFYSKIEKIVSLELQLRAERGLNPSLQDTRRWDLICKLAAELDLERHNVGGDPAYFLNEIRPYAFSNSLVDLREQ